MPTQPPRKVVLLDHTSNPPIRVDAELVREFPDTMLPSVEALWAPERAKLPPSMQHTHWDWVRKIGMPFIELIAVVANGQVEGLAAVARSSVASKITTGVAATYLMFLETAPWNLDEHPDGVRFAGGGSALLEEAVLISLGGGLGGRVQLTALAQAERFYRKRGMTELGPSSSSSLVYFEYTEAQAKAFLTSRGVTV